MTDLKGSMVASLDRRRMLQVVGAAGVAGALTACGGTSDSGNADTDPDAVLDDTPDGEDTRSEEPAEPDESGNEGEDDTGEADAIAATGDVPVGGGVIVDDVVVTQPAEGDFRAFSSTCTHQGCTVASVEDGTISCPCHGSQYSAEDGSVERGPAPAALPPVEITVEGDQILRG